MFAMDGFMESMPGLWVNGMPPVGEAVRET